MKKLATLLLLGLLTACSTTTDQCIHANNAGAEGDAFDRCDNLQPLNKRIFSFNLAADEYVIGPVAHAYHHVPDTGRAAISNFLTNLSEPSMFVNGILQGNFQGAGTSLFRFILNTTFGLAGFRDFAGENGLKYQDTNFGKTLGVYGFNDGSYLVLPLLGPSTLRDGTGQVVDWFLDPVGWFESTPVDIAQSLSDGIVTRDEQDPLIQQFYYESLDPYSATRAAYLQHSAALSLSNPPGSSE